MANDHGEPNAQIAEEKKRRAEMTLDPQGAVVAALRRLLQGKARPGHRIVRRGCGCVWCDAMRALEVLDGARGLDPA